jgi:hypothetical protein
MVYRNRLDHSSIPLVLTLISTPSVAVMSQFAAEAFVFLAVWVRHINQGFTRVHVVYQLRTAGRREEWGRQ